MPFANVFWNFLDQDGTVVVYRCYRTEMEIAAVLAWRPRMWLKQGGVGPAFERRMSHDIYIYYNIIYI